MPKIVDDSLDALPAGKPVDDDALDAIPESAPEALDPKDFDLVAWLQGLGPEVARYPLPGGGFIPLRLRSMEWRKEWAESTKDATDEGRALEFLAAHVADDRVTPAMLEALATHRPRDFDELCGLALQIDDRPSNQISPRFLPAASD